MHAGGPSCVVEEIVDTPPKPDHGARAGGCAEAEAEARDDGDAQRSVPSSSGSSAPTSAAASPGGGNGKAQSPPADSAAVAAAGGTGGDQAEEQQQQEDQGQPPQQQETLNTSAAAPAAEPAPSQQQQQVESTEAAAAPLTQRPPQQQEQQPAWEPADDDERAAVAAAEALKAEGNAAFGAGRFEDAAAKYQEALAAAPERAPQRATYHANLAAAYCKMGQHALAAEQATCALRADPKYVKALMRRAAAYEALDDPERAAADARAVLELDPSNAWAKAAGARLAPAVAAKQEALKAEMLSKLKELGNSVLGRFGLSLDNFKAEQDPETGGYSIKFQK